MMVRKYEDLFPLEISYFPKGSPVGNLILPGEKISKHSCDKYFIHRTTYDATKYV